LDRAKAFTTRSLAWGRPNLPSNAARSCRISVDGGLSGSSGMITVSPLPSIPRSSSGTTP
jgi:hypothetical protein